MKKNNRFLHVLSLLIFSVGVLVGMVVAGGTLWGDIEASVFDPGIIAQSSLRLTCPVAITTDEIGNISATIKNREEREKKFFVRAHISEGHVSLIREINQEISVVPGERGKIEWEVFPDDAAFNRIILFRVFVSPSYPIPSQGNSCGILVLDIPFQTGMQFFLLLLVLSLAFVIGGILIRNKITRPINNDIRSQTNALYALVIIVYGTILVSYLGLWLLGAILFAASILMIGIIFVRNYAAHL